MARCAACGGLNEPPNRPTRIPWLNSGSACIADVAELGLNGCPDSAAVYSTSYRTRSRSCLSGAVNTIFEACKLFGADRAAGVEFSGGDADFGAEAEFTAIGELRRGVVQDDRRIDLVEELARDGVVVGHDRIGVVRTVIVDMRDRLRDAIHHLGGDDRILIFGVPIFIGRRFDPGIGPL